MNSINNVLNFIFFKVYYFGIFINNIILKNIFIC